MKLSCIKIVCIKCVILLILALFIPTLSLADTYSPHVTARAAVLIEANSGNILFEKNSHKPLYPASTTKVITAILGLELGDIEEIAIISRNAANVGEASIYLRENQQVYLNDLIKGALIKSGNDASYAIGEHIAGNEAIFLMIMNKKAAIIGAENTSFHNTNGLPNEKHLSSAHDLALIGRYAMNNELFAQYVQIKEYRLEFVSGEVRNIKNTNRLLQNYPYATGIKTGTTKAAGQCLISSAQRDGKELIAVVLGSYARYADVINLFEYGFRNWNIYTLSKDTSIGDIEIRNGHEDLLNLYLARSVTEVYPRNSNFIVKKNIPEYIEAPVLEGTELGMLEIYIDDIKIQTIPIIAGADIKRLSIIEKLQRIFSKN